MTRTNMRMPALAAGLITGALVVGAAGVATAHTPTGDTLRGAGMHGGQAGHGMHAAGHMGSGMMGSNMGADTMGNMMAMMASHMGDMGSGMMGSGLMGSGMMGAIDEEAMADLRSQMSELHDQMLELHMQALEAEEDTDGAPQVEDATAPSPEASCEREGLGPVRSQLALRLISGPACTVRAARALFFVATRSSGGIDRASRDTDRGDHSMGKNSRRRREAKADAGSGSSTRADARSAARADRGDGRSFFDRYRNVLIGAVALIGVGLVGYMVFSSATASAYTCESLVEAPASQLDGETLGFPMPMGGAQHVEGSIDYVECPPTSGEHRGGGALVRDFYGPGTEQVPNDWIHNLEHGYAIIAYAGEPDSGTVEALRDAMDAAAPSQVAQECGLPNKVIALRFDDMSSPYAVLAWRWAVLLDDFDPELITSAATQFQDRPEAPERAC